MEFPFTMIAQNNTSESNFMIQVISRTQDLSFRVESLPDREEPENVLMCTPRYFDIIDVKNVHMKDNVGSTDKTKAAEQWGELRNVYDQLLQDGTIKELSVIEGAETCEDMVFCANQTLPWQLSDGHKVVVMGNMRHPSRQCEVPYFENFFREKGFTPLRFPGYMTFEGMGDVIPHPGKRLLYGGYGHRTAPGAYLELTEMLETPIIALQLVSPKFYHLDMCFVPLSSTSVMLVKEAFSPDGLKLIRQLFETVHIIPEDEAVTYFSLNAHAFKLNGKKVAIMQEGSTVARGILEGEGYEIVELDTSEFMRSGGSVFCMKMMYP